MANPLVSVGIPAFKRAHLEKALQCWAKQTYANFEVIVCDDASPEALEGVVQPFLRDERFSYTRSATNSAPYFARNWNRCLGQAKGKYFVLASDDDLYCDTFLERMVALAEAHPECDLFFSSWATMSRGVEGMILTPAPARRDWESAITFLYHRYCCGMRVIAPPVMARTEALCAQNGFADLPAAWFSDDLTWARLARRGGVTFCPETLVYFRMEGQNVTMNQNSFWIHWKLEATKSYCSVILSIVESLPVGDEMDRWRKAWLMRSLAPWLWNHCGELTWGLSFWGALREALALRRSGKMSSSFFVKTLVTVFLRQLKRLNVKR